MMMNTVTTQNAAVEMTVDSVLADISKALHRSTEGILDAARYIVQFRGLNDYPKLAKKLVEQKVMAKSTISQYMKIGKCAALYRNVDKLPASFNSIYHLAKIEGEKKGFIDDAIASGKLDRTTKLEDVRKWGETKDGVQNPGQARMA